MEGCSSDLMPTQKRFTKNSSSQHERLQKHKLFGDDACICIIMVILGITITTYNLQYAFLYTCFLLLLLNKSVVTLQSICISFELPSTFIFKSLIYCSMAKCFSNIFHLGLKRKCHVSSSQVK